MIQTLQESTFKSFPAKELQPVEIVLESKGHRGREMDEDNWLLILCPPNLTEFMTI